MPTFILVNKDTNDELSLLCPYTELQEFLKDNPAFEQRLTPLNIVRGISTRLKPDKGFRSILSEVKKRNPKGKIDDFGGG